MDVCHGDIFESIIAWVRRRRGETFLKWTKGHNGTRGNDEADRLRVANEGARKPMTLRDIDMANPGTGTKTLRGETGTPGTKRFLQDNMRQEEDAHEDKLGKECGGHPRANEGDLRSKTQGSEGVDGNQAQGPHKKGEGLPMEGHPKRIQDRKPLDEDRGVPEERSVPTLRRGGRYGPHPHEVQGRNA